MSQASSWLSGIDAPEKKQPFGERSKQATADLAMVSVGMAWWYSASLREQSAQERGQYEFAETEAKAKRAGLWRDAEPVPPWDWRKTQRGG